MTSNSKIANALTELVGGTPTIKLQYLQGDLDIELYAKLEFYNPAGSVKDRIGVSMIEAAEAEGLIEPDKSTVVEPTSGNTGIALAAVCAAKGYRLLLAMPEGMSRERESLLKLYGAEPIVTQSMGGMHEAVVEAERLASTVEDSFIPDQFKNPANPGIHRRTTAEEIWADLDGKVDVFVAGVGTGGTITGVGEVLKERLKDVKIVAVEPAASPVLSGGSSGPHKIQGIGAGFVPKVLNREIIDEVVAVSDQNAISCARKVAVSDGILAGISGGAALAAAIEVGSRPGYRGKRIVTVIPDSMERYISAPFIAP